MKCLRPPLATQASGWKPDTHRGNRHERGYGYGWEKTRERIKRRANALCEPHLAEGLVHEGQQCDHRVARAAAAALGWRKPMTESDDNLWWVCEAYHLEKTARETKMTPEQILAIFASEALR